MLKSIRLLTIAAATACATIFGAVSAQADAVSDFYSGKTVTILIGHPPGGSYDLYAQLLAQHFGKHIPGNPTVIVQGMPGGGGSLAAAHFYTKAPKDGTMVALLPESLAQDQVLDPKKSRWDVSKMRFIGRVADVTSVMMARKDSPVKSIEDSLKTEANVSCSGRTTSSAQTGAVLKSLIGSKFNMVCGYDSATASALAVFRGEADLTTTVWANWSVNYAQQLAAGDVVPVVQFSEKRLTDLPNTPTAVELTNDPAKKQAIEFFGAGGDIGRALMTPPGTPEDRIAGLSQAFDELMKDPDFLADAKARSIPIAPMGGKDVDAVVEKIITTPPDVVATLQKAIADGFNN
ncbi:tripartite-type tricarboxylate transporter receptor subunit TctC [Rhizobium petrolearium]|uniref:Bug family tripartite tricarboxylate transporter substrate binding protein n=1 Tax=Neorhizobium petrolearium TaxID=515361 RepID=UPI001AE4A99D|nr:tripartite tricarboxylate transporter substrate-binding protein [Neorhizobium petrolearium]MBP1845851.1 tripartite-type tricarboxylate transporter receptor subunit TctC [Neorhizobium petrolearium]